VLDNGDFVHLKPHGMRQFGLAPGMSVTAHGPARRLRFGPGRVIEAHEVDGERLAKPRPPKAH